MTTIIKIVIATLLSMLLASCNFDFHSGVRGNGLVKTEERSIDQAFSAIEANESLDVYLTQGNETSIFVEADENLQDLILTDIEGGVLKIHTKENIRHADAKKVIITFQEVSKITSTSGSHVYATNTLAADHLEISSTSGGQMELDVNTVSLYCNSTSGSYIRLSGKTSALTATATSGSDIEAADLMAETSEVKATSGADITVNTSKALTANATSGGDINYYGNPQKVEKSNNSSGNIRKK